ncbi:hypothetical protein ABZ714_22960 [Streptomyces sp. NPDC006798]|uniref:DUF6907 domain-containing protein n=1 Tax=Streptomyces sp. NPDC006798 TaxID=3155462 RepID=UPI0033C2B062
MDALEWKKTVTGPGACPGWCVSAHTEDPGHEAVVHTSRPATVPLPPLVSGGKLTLTFTTVAHEDFHHPERGRTPVRVDASLETERGMPVHDYIPVPGTPELDALITGLRDAADALQEWRPRLPEAG